VITFILNEPAYGSERSYNGLRLALSLAKSQEVRVFLMGDAVSCGISGQETPDGFYNIARMIRGLVKRGVLVYACVTCCDARGIAETLLIDGVVKSDLQTLTDWVKSSAQSLTF